MYVVASSHLGRSLRLLHDRHERREDAVVSLSQFEGFYGGEGGGAEPL